MSPLVGLLSSNTKMLSCEGTRGFGSAVTTTFGKVLLPTGQVVAFGASVQAGRIGAPATIWPQLPAPGLFGKQSVARLNAVVTYAEFAEAFGAGAKFAALALYLNMLELASVTIHEPE